MSNKYTTNKNAIADCDVCGFQFKLKKLKDLYVRKTITPSNPASGQQGPCNNKITNHCLVYINDRKYEGV